MPSPELPPVAAPAGLVPDQRPEWSQRMVQSRPRRVDNDPVSAESFPELLARAQHGDELAFAVLFRQTQPVLLRYLSALCDRGRAEDVASDTWVNVVRDLDRFVGDQPAAFRGWVLSIARRRWIDDLRRRSRRTEYLTAVLPEPAGADDTSAIVESNLGADWTTQLIRTLPPDQAEVLLLRVVADLDVADTAAIVGKSPGAVRVLAHRGLRRLEEILQPGVTNRALRSVGG